MARYDELSVYKARYDLLLGIFLSTVISVNLGRKIHFQCKIESDVYL